MQAARLSWIKLNWFLMGVSNLPEQPLQCNGKFKKKKI